MTRKEMLLVSGAAIAAYKTSGLFAETKDQKGTGNPHLDLSLAASACVVNGERCIDHCLDLLRNGDETMHPCSKAAHDMTAICRAMVTLAASKSPMLKKYMAICKEACETCAAACEKHTMHEPCKRCAESCRACIAAMKAVA